MPRFPQHVLDSCPPLAAHSRILQAGVTRSVGPPHEDKKLAKLAAVQASPSAGRLSGFWAAALR